MSQPEPQVSYTPEANSVRKDDSSSSSDSLDIPQGYHQSRGVTRMENLYRTSNNRTLWIIGACVVACAWAYSLDSSTTNNYTPFVTSYFKNHSAGLSALSVATSIIGAVAKPFIAKFSDVVSRPYTYILILSFYVIGYIIVASCRTLSAYIVGEVFSAIGGNGLDLLNDIIVGDLTPLEWRGFVSSLLASPFIINLWIAGPIVQSMLRRNQWRWGYGMFAIIMPGIMIPAIVVLIYLDRKAHKLGIVNIASSKAARREARQLAAEKGEEGPHGAIVVSAPQGPKKPWIQQVREGLTEIDGFGLILLGFGWTLLLLPFSLKSTAEKGWKNPSLIAMMIVGGLLLIAYTFYERFVAKVPSFPGRFLRNRTFLMAILIDSFYMIAGNLRGLYFSSYTWIITDWSETEWTYFGGTLTLALCIFGIVAGLIQRWTHRYKFLQVFGLCIKIIGIGIMLKGHRATDNVVAMTFTQILVGAGGAFSVVGSRVASQASVPHQDMALTISLLALWSKIGSAIGAAIAAVIWAKYMPRQLRAHLPASVTDKQITTFFKNIKAIRDYPFDHPVRQGAITAYQNTLWYLIVPAVSLSFIPLIASLFQTNFYLGKQQNAVMHVGNNGLPLVDDKDREMREEMQVAPPATFKERLLRFWAGKP